jgi:Bacterial capsule synthesis protein PGA_cap
MADRRPPHPPTVFSLRRLRALALLVASTLAVVTILLSGGSGERPEPAEARASAGAGTITLGWAGDVTPGSRYGLPAGNGRALFDGAGEILREPDLMAVNLEGTFSVGGASKCAPASADCFAFQAPPVNAGALRAAGIDIVNLANNHSFDFGAAGQAQTAVALTRTGVAFAGMRGEIRILRRRGIRVAFVGFSTYRWTPSMNDPAAVRALVGRAAARADVVVALFHAGAEGADRTDVPVGREWAFGEDRGDSRAFAHQAIDAGADLVLGSGPHVIRGLEVYRGRLIAYSLGNFAGAGNFASGGTLSVSAVLTARLDRRGRLRSGWWHGMALDAAGIPHPDRGASRALVTQLSARDFGVAAPRVLAGGRLLPPR